MSGINIVKYIIRRNFLHSEGYYSKLKLVNRTYRVMISTYYIFSIIWRNLDQPKQIFIEVHLFSRFILLYWWLKYILKIIRVMHIKSLCLKDVTNLLSMNDSNYISSLINEDHSLKREVDRPLIPINFLDEYSLKSVGIIQKVFYYLWGSEAYGMQMMLFMMFLWCLSLASKLHSYLFIENIQPNPDDFVLLFVTTFVCIYIIYLSAEINDFFKQQKYVYLKLKS